MIDKKYHNYAHILKIKVDSTTTPRVLREVQSKLDKEQKFYIVTPNPEQIIYAQSNLIFAKILNSADISIADGIGLTQAYKFLSMTDYRRSIYRPLLIFCQGILVGLATIFNKNWLTKDFKVIKGREMFLELIKLANKKSYRVMFFGGRSKVSKKAAENLSKNYKGIKFQFSDGPEYDNNLNPLTPEDKGMEKEIVELINNFKPQLIFVGLGAPKQEKWIVKWLPKLKFGGAMVVGGTLDYFAGTAKMPPKYVSDFGFEWLWRLFTQPWRIKRIYTATVVFPWKVFKYKLDLRN